MEPALFIRAVSVRIGSKLFYKTIHSVSQKENKFANIFRLLDLSHDHSNDIVSDGEMGNKGKRTKK